jgi:phosphohistidine phosphatase
MAMYFVQHGLSLSKEVNPDRPLSDDGRREVEGISVHLRDAGVKIDKVCHSGKTRAEQTAQIFADNIGDGKVYEQSGMNPNDDVKVFASSLNKGDIMYVGHLPHMGKLVSFLVAGDENADVVKYSNGGVVCVEKDNDSYHILWTLTPALCKG